MLEQTDIITEDASETPAGDASTRPRRRRRRFDSLSIGVAGLVVLAGTGLYYMHWATQAGMALINETDAKAASVQTFLNGGQQDLVSLSKSIRQTHAVVDRFARQDNVMLANAGKTLDRDPFAFEVLEAAPTVTPNDGAATAARAQAKAKALAGARQLQVQSIMYGSAKRACLINGKLYFEGQPVGDFIVHTIGQDAVIVQSGPFRFELRLGK